MEKNTYNQTFLLENKTHKTSITVTTIICFFCLLIIEFFSSDTIIINQYLLHKPQCYLGIIPVMILTFLSGYGVGGIVVLAFFSVECIFSHQLLYHTIVLLISSLLIVLPVSRHWFKSFKKMIIVWLVFSIILGNFCSFLVTVLEARPLDFSNEINNFLTAFFPCGIVCFFCFFFYKFVPCWIQSIFFVSVYESAEFQNVRSMIARRKGSGIGSKLASLILIEAISLLIAGFGFANGLLDQMQMLTGWEKIVFATRLVALMTIVGVPIILLTLSQATLRIANPLILMSQAAEDSYICNLNSKKKYQNTPLIDLKSIHIKAKDEIGVLYDALVRAFDNTNAYIANLEREKQLETELAAAKAATKAKSDFLSAMSHEIRTPINAVLGLDEMIIRESSEPEIQKYAVDIENAGKSLLSIVNDILDFSKIEAGKLEIIPVNYGLASMVNDLINMISKRVKDKNLSLIINVDSSMPNLLTGDDVRIKQCILNILTNAVKYTAKGSVTLKINGKKDGIDHILMTVHVIDTGIGIKKEDIPKLDSAFQRIEEERNRTIEGTGLGLNIVKNLLSLMDSKLEVQSEYGKGSDFYFTLRQRVCDWKPVGDVNEMYERSLLDMAAYKECFHAPDAKILVVDDTELNLTVVKGLLKQTGIQIDTALSGHATLELVAKNKYDVIFLDHRMPGMDGIETLHAMKALATNLNAEVPCIALTANAVSGAKEMYLEEGFNDYLTKPVESKNLESLLLKYIPKEKIKKNSDDVFQSENSDIKNEDVTERFKDVSGISIEDALKFTGDPDVLEQTLCVFYDDIDSKSSAIENYAKQEDVRNYTVLVHALKSSARLIGALELSELAKKLEEYGDKENLQEIQLQTPHLLELYRSYKKNLAPLCEKVIDGNREEISITKYEEALSAVKESVIAFDFDTADAVIKMLEDYKIPLQKEQQFNELKHAVQVVDRDLILSLLNKD